MFEPNASWSLPEHLYLVSEWSAFCTDPLNPFSCTNALQNPNSAADSAVTSAARLRLDRHDLPAAPARRELGLLRVPGHRARLRGRRRDDLRPRAAGRRRPRASGTRCPRSPTSHRTASSANIQTLSNFFAAAKSGHAAGRVLDRPQRQGVRASHRRWSAPARRTSPAWSTRSCRARTGTAPRSSSPGTTGAGSTTTSCRRSSTRTATACGCPAS